MVKRPHGLLTVYNSECSFLDTNIAVLHMYMCPLETCRECIMHSWQAPCMGGNAGGVICHLF